MQQISHTKMLAEDAVLRPSRHVTFLRTESPSPIAYHNLFGNLSVLDEELYRFLSHAPEQMTLGALRSAVGREIARDLWNSYFFVEHPDEERKAVEQMLEERKASVNTGRYLGALQITSSNACNYACSYCFADASDRRSPVRTAIARQTQNIPYELAEAAIRQLLDVAERHGREKIAVKFLGREPLINWEVIDRLFQTFGCERVVWAITTNGSLLNEEIAKKLRAYNVLTIVSLDGPPETNDGLRVLKSGKGTYEITERGLETLSRSGVRFGVSSVVSSQTRLEQMEQFIDRLVELGASELELTLVMQTKLFQIQSRAPEPSALAEKLCGLYRHGSERLLMHGDWIDPYHRIRTTHKFRSQPEVVRPAGASCSATSHQISLEPTGDVFPCRAMSTHYGNIADLDGILNSKNYHDVVMRTFYNVPACHGCQLEGFCQGTCLGSAEEQSGDIYQPPQEYCDVYRATTKLLLEEFGAGC